MFSLCTYSVLLANDLLQEKKRNVNTALWIDNHKTLHWSQFTRAILKSSYKWTPALANKTSGNADTSALTFHFAVPYCVG